MSELNKQSAAKLRIQTALEHYGILLLSDQKLPSLVGLVSEEPVRGSWWAHPLGKTMYALASQLEEDRDVMVIKLIAGKITYVHRRFWSAVITIATAKDGWQLNNLSDDARKLFDIVEHKGSVLTNSLPTLPDGTKPGSACDELEKRMLIYAAQVHTDSGSHTKQAQSWQYWCEQNQFRPIDQILATAKADLQNTVDQLNTEFGAKVKLPWL